MSEREVVVVYDKHACPTIIYWDDLCEQSADLRAKLAVAVEAAYREGACAFCSAVTFPTNESDLRRFWLASEAKARLT